MSTLSSVPPPEDDTERQWRRRPRLAALIRAVVVLAPLAGSTAAGVAASRAFRPHDLASLVGWLVWTAAVSVAALAVMDAFVRRLLPLQRLLQLCLVFPDRAPSRLRTAVRAAWSRRPEALLGADAVPERAADAAEHIVRLLGALSMHDRRTRGHSERVCAYTELLAEQMHLEQADRDRLMWVALVHDIGKLDVPRRLLNKPGRPTVSEWHVLQAHPARGAAITAPLREWLGEWADAVGQHHERYDGSGYPNGLSGEQICFGARILAVTDAFEVMTAPRPYRRPVDPQSARAELARHAGTQFDPGVVRHFLAVGLPELRRSMGLLAWLAQLPFIREWPRLQSTASAATAQAMTSSAVATAAGALAFGAGSAVGVAQADVPAHAGVIDLSVGGAHGTGGAQAVAHEQPVARSHQHHADVSRHSQSQRHHESSQPQPDAVSHPHAHPAATPRERDTSATGCDAASDSTQLGWQRARQRRADRANERASGPPTGGSGRC